MEEYLIWWSRGWYRAQAVLPPPAGGVPGPGCLSSSRGWCTLPGWYPVYTPPPPYPGYTRPAPAQRTRHDVQCGDGSLTALTRTVTEVTVREAGVTVRGRSERFFKAGKPGPARTHSQCTGKTVTDFPHLIPESEKVAIPSEPRKDSLVTRSPPVSFLRSFNCGIN